MTRPTITSGVQPNTELLRIERALWNDPATGVMRHADAGYDEAIETARGSDLDLPFLS